MTEIAIERIDDDLYAFIAIAGDVQVGWCRRLSSGWHISDMDEKSIAGPFESLEEAQMVGLEIFLPKSGVSNPGY